MEESDEIAGLTSMKSARFRPEINSMKAQYSLRMRVFDDRRHVDEINTEPSGSAYYSDHVRFLNTRNGNLSCIFMQNKKGKSKRTQTPHMVENVRCVLIFACHSGP